MARHAFVYEEKSDFPESEFEISESKSVPSPKTAENEANKNVIPYTPVMSAICVSVFHLYAVMEMVPHG